jgi:hypothetical protein
LLVSSEGAGQESQLRHLIYPQHSVVVEVALLDAPRASMIAWNLLFRDP